MASLGRDAGGGQLQPLKVGGPAHREEHRIHQPASGPIRLLVVDLDAALGLDELLGAGPVTTSMPRRVKAASRAAERSWSARGMSRGASSSNRVWQPKSARMEASWQPVSAPPMTATRPGSAVGARRSV
jgi:hypothetical protein